MNVVSIILPWAPYQTSEIDTASGSYNISSHYGSRNKLEISFSNWVAYSPREFRGVPWGYLESKNKPAGSSWASNLPEDLTEYVSTLNKGLFYVKLTWIYDEEVYKILVISTIKWNPWKDFWVCHHQGTPTLLKRGLHSLLKRYFSKS